MEQEKSRPGEQGKLNRRRGELNAGMPTMGKATNIEIAAQGNQLLKHAIFTCEGRYVSNQVSAC